MRLEPGMEENFQQELQHMARAKHPNIIRFFGWSQNGDRKYLVMEHLPIGDLSDVLFAGRILMDWPLFFRFASDIVSGIIYIHNQLGIVHRDLKPQNIMIDIGTTTDALGNSEFSIGQLQRCKIIDFGISRTGQVDNATKGGTFGYMAPEYDSLGKLTFSSDIFSFGVILLSMITCKDPWAGVDEDDRQTRIFCGSMPTIPEWVPNQLQDLIKSCWNEDPQKRPLPNEIAKKFNEIRTNIIENTPSLFLLAKSKVEGKELFASTALAPLLGQFKVSFIYSANSKILGISLALQGNFVFYRALIYLDPSLVPENSQEQLQTKIIRESDGNSAISVELQRNDIQQILHLGGEKTSAYNRFYSQGPSDSARITIRVENFQFVYHENLSTVVEFNDSYNSNDKEEIKHEESENVNSESEQAEVELLSGTIFLDFEFKGLTQATISFGSIGCDDHRIVDYDAPKINELENNNQAKIEEPENKQNSDSPSVRKDKLSVPFLLKVHPITFEISQFKPNLVDTSVRFDLIFMGSRFSGKTSLFGACFNCTGKEKELITSYVTYQDRTYKLMAWDTHRMHGRTITDNYLRNKNSVFLVVVDFTDFQTSVDDAIFMINRIAQQASCFEQNVVIVANKLELLESNSHFESDSNWIKLMNMPSVAGWLPIPKLNAIEAEQLVSKSISLLFHLHNAAQLQKEERTLKICIVGPEQSGKTSLCRRYVHDSFPNEYIATIGVDFYMKKEEKLSLQLWDLGGQSRFANMTRVYMRDALGVLIVFDVQQFQNREKVISHIRDIHQIIGCNTYIPIVVVVNKCNENVGEENSPDFDDFFEEIGIVAQFFISVKRGDKYQLPIQCVVQEALQRFPLRDDEEENIVDLERDPRNRRDNEVCC